MDYGTITVKHVRHLPATVKTTIAALKRMRKNNYDGMVGGVTTEVISLNQLSPSCVISSGRE